MSAAVWSGPLLATTYDSGSFLSSRLLLCTKDAKLEKCSYVIDARCWLAGMSKDTSDRRPNLKQPWGAGMQCRDHSRKHMLAMIPYPRPPRRLLRPTKLYWEAEKTMGISLTAGTAHLAHLHLLPVMPILTKSNRPKP